MASVALANGINANMLRNWVVRSGAVEASPLPESKSARREEFVALPLEGPRPAIGGEIRIELRRGATTVAISWPVASAQECAAWLQSWLR